MHVDGKFHYTVLPGIVLATVDIYKHQPFFIDLLVPGK